MRAVDVVGSPSFAIIFQAQYTPQSYWPFVETYSFCFSRAELDADATRSIGPAKAVGFSPVVGTRYIVDNRAKAECLRVPVSSNVDTASFCQAVVRNPVQSQMGIQAR